MGDSEDYLTTVTSVLTYTAEVALFYSAYRTKSLCCCLFVSIIVHAFVLLLSLRLLYPQRPPPVLIKANLADPFAANPSQPVPKNQPQQERRTVTLKPNPGQSSATPAERTAPRPSANTTPSEEPETSSQAISTGLGPITIDPSGSPVGGGSSTGTGTSPFETDSQAGTPTASGAATRPPNDGTFAPSHPESIPRRQVPPAVAKDDLDLTKIPDAQFRAQQNSIVFYEADVYVLFAGSANTAISIPGTELCVDGGFIRTMERHTLAQTVTHLEQCWVMDDGESDRMICPPNAETSTVYFNDYLRTPIEYKINHCLAYDDTHCYTIDSDDSDKEICKVNFVYQGIWAADTNFDYRCTKSETRTFTNSLEYTIRYMEIVDHGEERNSRPKQFHRVVRSIPQCKK